MIRILNFLMDYERIIRFRWGNFEGVKGPGPVFMIPIIHSGIKLDLRTQVIDIPRQTNITKDNAPIYVDFLIYLRIIEEYAERAVLQVQDYREAVIGLATTTLRAVIGDIDLDDVLSQRERINDILRSKLDSETERWGIKVTNVEIREIEPPTDIQEAMNRQMSSERIRRAVVREAQGTKESEITIAEGQKQAAILTAEGQKQAEILTAEGFSAALGLIEQIAKDISKDTLSLQYFDTLKQIGASESTKYIFPMEFTNALKPFIDKTKSE